MDFSASRPSHTLLLIITLLAFGGQLVAILTYLKTTANQHSRDLIQLAERIDKQGETFFHAMERLEERIDKRLIETNKRIDEANQHIRDVRTELHQLNQNHIEHLTHHER